MRLRLIVEYVNIVVIEGINLPKLKEQLKMGLSVEDYQFEVKSMDTKRRICHEAAIDACSKLNRACQRFGLEPFYKGDTSDRYYVADFAIEFVRAVYDENRSFNRNLSNDEFIMQQTNEIKKPINKLIFLQRCYQNKKGKKFMKNFKISDFIFIKEKKIQDIAVVRIYNYSNISIKLEKDYNNKITITATHIKCKYPGTYLWCHKLMIYNDKSILIKPPEIDMTEENISECIAILQDFAAIIENVNEIFSLMDDIKFNPELGD